MIRLPKESTKLIPTLAIATGARRAAENEVLQTISLADAKTGIFN